MEQDIASQIVGLGGASDFSLWSLFLRADFVVKFVIILLIASSIFSWALIFDKFKLFKKLINLPKILKISFGTQSLQKLFIIISPQPLRIQWLYYLGMRCKIYLKEDQKLI